MKTSFDHLRREAFRALDAGRAAAGVDEDSAYAVAWLEACGFPGLAMLAVALDGSSRETRSAGLAPAPDGRIDAGGRSCLFFAPCLVDYLVARGEAGKAAHHEGLVLANAMHPIALVASAARFCPDGCAVTIRWQGADGSQVEAHAGPMGARVEGVDRWDADAPVAMVELAFDADFDHAATPADGQVLADRLARSLREGIEVDAGAWMRVSAYAAGILVPESEESRARGAGAGLTDND
jgi:hypothetical protein